MFEHCFMYLNHFVMMIMYKYISSRLTDWSSFFKYSVVWSKQYYVMIYRYMLVCKKFNINMSDLSLSGNRPSLSLVLYPRWSLGIVWIRKKKNYYIYSNVNTFFFIFCKRWKYCLVSSFELLFNRNAYIVFSFIIIFNNRKFNLVQM